jgi:hypothetical protein
MRKFEKAFTLPFKLDEDLDWIYDSNHHFAFQLQANINESDKKRLIDCINGIKVDKKPNHKIERDFGTIILDGKALFLIRGWGYLTGGGGLNLSEGEAIEIQDDLGDYIVEMLSRTIKN